MRVGAGAIAGVKGARTPRTRIAVAFTAFTAFTAMEVLYFGSQMYSNLKPCEHFRSAPLH